MVRLLSIISLILTVVLAPPAVLALMSNNAVPGDRTYPIKRTLENVIVVVASINPNTKASFTQTRSNRRYKEFSTLIAQGKQTSSTLNELVDQTDLAVAQLSQVIDTKEKEKLIAQLSLSIEKYDAGLKDVSSAQSTIALEQQPAGTTTLADNSSSTSEVVIESPASEPVAEPTPSPVGAVSATPRATTTPRPTATATPRPTATPRLTPTPSLQPTVRSSSTAQPTPTPSPERDEEAQRQRNREIEEARRRLEEIKKQLKQERRKSSISTDKHQDEKKPKEKEAEKSSKEDKSDNSDKKNN